MARFSVHRGLIQETHAVCRDQLVRNLAGHWIRYIDCGTVLPGLLLFDSLQHCIFPYNSFLRVDGPRAHHDVFLEKLAAIKRARNSFLHVVSQRVHGAVTPNQAMYVLLDEGEEFCLPQTRSIRGHETAKDLDQESLQLLDQVELGQGPVSWLLEKLPKFTLCLLLLC